MVLVATCAAVLAVLLAKELLCELVLVLVVVDIAADVLEGEKLVQSVHVRGARYFVWLGHVYYGVGPGDLRCHGLEVGDRHEGGVA